MNLPQNTVVAVADGEKLSLFRNDGDAATVNLTALPDPAIDSSKISSGARHSSSWANPDDSQQDEDGFGAGVTDMLNKQVLNCPPFRPDSRHKQKGSSTGLRTGLCLTSIDTLNC